MVKGVYKIFLGVCLFALPAAAHAATMEISPEFTLLQVGQSITLTIVTQSSEPVNAVTATLSFPADILSVTSISKNDSAFTLWVQKPTFSNTSGTISFSGIVPDPGVNDRALVLVVRMRANRAGTAVLRFNSAAVLANDGQGTNVITGTTPASITVTPSSTPAPAPAVKETPAATPAVQEEPSAPKKPLFEPPVITQYQNIAREYGPVSVSGTSRHTGSSVADHFVSGNIKIKGTASVDPSGNFKYVHTGGLPAGDYSIYAIVQDWNGVSGNSNTVYMEVLSVNRVLIIGFSVPVWLLVLITSILSVLLFLLGTYSYIRIRHLKHHIAFHYHKR